MTLFMDVTRVRHKTLSHYNLIIIIILYSEINPETEDPEVIPITGPPTLLHLNAIYN